MNEHQVHRGLRHLSTFTASGAILGLIALSGIIYNGSGTASLGPSSTLILEGVLAAGVLIMVTGIMVLIAKFK